MHTRKMAVNLSHEDVYQGEGMRRRVAVCRQRLRRNRTTQRMAEREAARAARAPESFADAGTRAAEDGQEREP